MNGKKKIFTRTIFIFWFNNDVRIESSTREFWVYGTLSIWSALWIWNALWILNVPSVVRTVSDAAETANVRVEAAEEVAWTCTAGSKFRDTGCCIQQPHTGANEGLRRLLGRARTCTRCLCGTLAHCARTRSLDGEAEEVRVFSSATRRQTQTCKKRSGCGGEGSRPCSDVEGCAQGFVDGFVLGSRCAPGMRSFFSSRNVEVLSR